jgi:hypothetical protein
MMRRGLKGGLAREGFVFVEHVVGVWETTVVNNARSCSSLLHVLVGLRPGWQAVGRGLCLYMQ